MAEKAHFYVDEVRKGTDYEVAILWGKFIKSIPPEALEKGEYTPYQKAEGKAILTVLEERGITTDQALEWCAKPESARNHVLQTMFNWALKQLGIGFLLFVVGLALSAGSVLWIGMLGTGVVMMGLGCYSLVVYYRKK